jgi:hypothetical protein
VRSQEEDRHVIQALANSLADEATARPETIRSALRELVHVNYHHIVEFFGMLAQGRYGRDFREVAGKEFIKLEADDFENSGYALSEIIRWQVMETEDKTEAAKRLLKMLESAESIVKCEGILGLMHFCFTLRNNPDSIKANDEILRCLGDELITILSSEQPAEQFAASWALVWLGACRVWQPPVEADMPGRLFKLWRHSPKKSIQRMALWALVSQPISSRDATRHYSTIQSEELKDLLEATALPEKPEKLDDSKREIATLLLAWYLQALNDSELLQRAYHLLKDPTVLDQKSQDHFGGRTLRELLGQLGMKADQIDRAFLESKETK